MSFRYALGLEYDGAAYNGWQRQKSPELPTVQASLERALGFVAKGRGAPAIAVQCAGRTDARVHASHQVVHFESPIERPEKAWVLGSNANMEKDISVKWAKPIRADFHARFSATARRYRYVICNREIRPAHLRNNVTWVRKPLDEALMQSEAHCLIGEQDFSAFRGAGCQSNTPMRNVHFVNVTRSGDYVVVDIQANAFLLHMVRNIVGVLIEVGSGESPSGRTAQVLAGRNRSEGGVTGKPYGLYLIDVLYPDEFNIPKSELGPFFLGDAF